MKVKKIRPVHVCCNVLIKLFGYKILAGVIFLDGNHSAYMYVNQKESFYFVYNCIAA